MKDNKTAPPTRTLSDQTQLERVFISTIRCTISGLQGRFHSFDEYFKWRTLSDQTQLERACRLRGVPASGNLVERLCYFEAPLHVSIGLE